MTDLSALTHDQFTHCIDDVFPVALDDTRQMPLTLRDVKTRGAFDPEVHPRQAFSAYFHGPAEPLLPQRMYRLCDTPLGELDLFLVPVERDGDGVLYEAVFT